MRSELKEIKWKEILLSDYFHIRAGKYYYSSEYEEGTTPYVSATVANNGISEYINLAPDFKGNCITTEKISSTAFYQKYDFCATSDINIFTPKFEQFNEYIGIFISTIINFDQNYRWSYGRQCRVGDSKKIKIKLPVKDDDIPDWEYMENHVKQSNHKKIKTKNSIRQDKSLELKVEDWKEFYLHKIFHTVMGNGIDAGNNTYINPKYNYVSRNSNDNGIVDYVDEIEGIDPFPAGSITIALGGSYLGSSFIQSFPFYTAQNVGVLLEKEPLSNAAKLFITTLIKKESRTKFQAFGRELNAHFRKSFILKLPIKKKNGLPIIDNTNEYSDKGYIPDWEYMDRLIRILPYGDRL